MYDNKDSVMSEKFLVLEEYLRDMYIEALTERLATRIGIIEIDPENVLNRLQLDISEKAHEDKGD